MSQRKKVDPKMNIVELLELYPELGPILTYEYGLYCINCIIADFDNLENGAKIHGIEDEDLEDMLAHLEEIINE